MNAKVAVRTVSVQTSDDPPQDGDTSGQPASSSAPRNPPLSKPSVPNFTRERAYRKLLVRSAGGRRSNNDPADLVSSRMTNNLHPVCQMPVAHLKSGTVARSLGRQHSIADLNASRGNYRNYCHYRKTTRGTETLNEAEIRHKAIGDVIHGIAQFPSIWKAPQKLARHPTIPHTAPASSGNQPTSVPENNKNDNNNNETRDSRPKTPLHPSRRHDAIISVNKLNGYELRGSSMYTSKEPPTGRSDSPQQKGAERGARPTSSDRGKKLDVGHPRARPGIYASYTRANNALNFHSVDDYSHDQHRSYKPEVDYHAYRMFAHDVSSESRSRAKQSSKSLTEGNLRMLESLTEQEDQEEAEVTSEMRKRRRRVSARVIQWVHQRQIHIQVPSARMWDSDDGEMTSYDSVLV